MGGSLLSFWRDAGKPLPIGIIFGSFLLCSLGSAQATLSNEKDQSPIRQDNHQKLCLQSLNLYGPVYAPHVRSRTRRFVNSLNIQGPCPLVQLQEVWVESHRELLFDLVNHRLAGLQAFSMDDFRDDDWMTGLFQITSGRVISQTSRRFRINTDGALDHVRKWLNVGKGFSVSRLQWRNKSPQWNHVRFINLHLHPQSQPIRLAQVLELHEYLDQNQKPLVLSGDFNAEPHSLEMRFLRTIAGFRDTLPNSKECTLCDDNPLSWSSRDRRIDYILVRSGEHFHLDSERTRIVFRSTRYSSYPLSDHYGIQTDLKLISRDGFKKSSNSLSREKYIMLQIIDRLAQENEKRYDPFIDYAFEILNKITNAMTAQGGLYEF